MNNKYVPLSFKALEDGFSISFSNSVLYSIDGGEWNSLQANEYTKEVNKGSIISFKEAGAIMGYGWIGKFFISKKCNVYGMCASILPKLYDEQYISDWLYAYLFEGCAIVEANDLILPATTLASYCYSYMFYNCTSLTTAPELHATTLALACYLFMFYGCKKLTDAPALPATTLARDCYDSMFSGCINLTKAPELPATTLADYCYYYMFSGCTNLSYIKMLATDISATDCLYRWVEGVSPAGIFVKNKNANWDTTPGALDTSGVPAGWMVVNDGEESGGEVKLISFTIVEMTFPLIEVEYNAIEGMTWVEWVDSEYNTGGYYIYEKHVLTPDRIDVTHYDTGIAVVTDEVIISKKYGWG